MFDWDESIGSAGTNREIKSLQGFATITTGNSLQNLEKNLMLSCRDQFRDQAAPFAQIDQPRK